MKKTVALFVGSLTIFISVCLWYARNSLILRTFQNQVRFAAVRIPLSTPPPIPSSVPIVWSLVITGDIIPARVVNIEMTKRNDFAWPLRGIKNILQNADLTLIDLEAPLLTNCPLTNEGFKFCGDSRFAAALYDSGVDVANLANNHTLNYGWEGIKETEEELAKVGIETTGFTFNSSCYASSESEKLSSVISAHSVIPAKAGIQKLQSFTISEASSLDPGFRRDDTSNNLDDNNQSSHIRSNNDNYCSKLLVKEVRATNSSPTTHNSPPIKVGFLGYNAVGQRIDRELAKKQIESADQEVDVLVISVHWGKEYERDPVPDLSIAPDDPKELGRLFIDWGADVVVGNHPHWYQPFDFAQGKDGKDKLIFYALGNTIFDQEWSTETKRGYLAKLYFTGTQIRKEKVEIFPIGIRNYGEAYLLEGEEKETMLDFVNN